MFPAIDNLFNIYFCNLYRLIQKNYDVVAYMADIGQNEDFEKAKQKAKAIGAKEVSSQHSSFFVYFLDLSYAALSMHPNLLRT